MPAPGVALPPEETAPTPPPRLGGLASAPLDIALTEGEDAEEGAVAPIVEPARPQRARAVAVAARLWQALSRWALAWAEAFDPAPVGMLAVVEVPTPAVVPVPVRPAAVAPTPV
jgi:hypothetical protein